MQEDILKLLGNDPRIKISASQLKDKNGKVWVVITCEDSGAGWDWDQMPEDVWERYQYIKKATEKNHGIFEYKVVEGKGATVIVKLPVEVNSNGESCISKIPQRGVAMKKVLIVDDELEFVNDFARGLEMFGYEAYQARDGEGALNVIENRKPDIVLCDYRLPDIDGDSILEKTKASHPNIKFVMITAYYDEAVEKRLRNLGADEVIFKPIILTDIEALLAKL